MSWEITDKETKDTKWSLGARLYTNEYQESKGYTIMGEDLAPYCPVVKCDPKIFDTKEEVLEWIEELKDQLSHFINIEDNQSDNFQLYYKRSVYSVFIYLRSKHDVRITDFEDGFKVYFSSYDDSVKGEITFKPFLVREEK